MTAQSPRSLPFKKTRAKRLVETAEDYTELIYELINSKGEARTCDVAREMGVSHVTAIKAIKRLVRDGFAQTQSHQPITLTLKGEALAIKSRQRHEILIQFLTKLGVSAEVAAADVEGIEHYISEETLAAIVKFLG